MGVQLKKNATNYFFFELVATLVFNVQIIAIKVIMFSEHENYLNLKINNSVQAGGTTSGSLVNIIYIFCRYLEKL